MKLKDVSKIKFVDIFFYKAGGYMKKMFIKYKILVNGLNPIGIYTLDGFTMKKGTFKERMFDMKYNQDNIGINLNMNLYLMSCLNDYKKFTYNYF